MAGVVGEEKDDEGEEKGVLISAQIRLERHGTGQAQRVNTKSEKEGPHPRTPTVALRSRVPRQFLALLIYSNRPISASR